MGEHFVQFYDGDTFLVEEILGFIGSGLWAGDAGVVIASRPHLQDLEKRLSESGLDDASRPSYAGRYIALDAQEMLSKIMVDDWPDEARFREVIGNVLDEASGGGRVRVRAFGEMVSALCLEGNQKAALKIEEYWDNLSTKHSFSLLCAYPMSAFAMEEHGPLFHDVCAAHSHVCLAESFKLPTSQDELRRTIAILQQKANALESEVARRKKIETALHHREKELTDFLENAVEAMHRLGPDGTILWANKAELELLGYSPEEYIGHNVGEFHVDREVIADILDKLRREETVYDHPSRVRCKDGTIRHVLIHSNALVKDGEFVSTRCLTRDVTDRVQLGEELQRKLEELADVDRRKDEFLAMLGHELRNPLAPIMTSLDLMRAYGNDAEQIARSRAMITRQVMLMTRLVDDLLDVSRITRGTIDLKTETVALDDIVERALEIARPLIDERQHQVTLNLPATPLWLHGDPPRLAQILANLLHNAAKYTDAGGSITISASKENGRLVLVVRDNGIGMDAALRERVFDLFVQGADSRSRARGGLGLGLTLVRSLVHLHGGSVEAHSAGPGRGSEFVVMLPLTPPPEPRENRNPEVRETKPHGTARNILIVDDNVDAAESLSELLRAFGHRTHIAHDGPSAIEQAGRLRPEVVILDIGLPAMNGYQVARRLRSDLGLTSAILVALTGYAQERDRICAEEAGFNYHFAKPLDIARLTAVVNNIG